jgi:hypothetical protein
MQGEEAAQVFYMHTPPTGPGTACLHDRRPRLSAAGAVLPSCLSHQPLQCQGGHTQVQDVHRARDSGGQRVPAGTGGDWAARRVGANVVRECCGIMTKEEKRATSCIT